MLLAAAAPTPCMIALIEADNTANCIDSRRRSSAARYLRARLVSGVELCNNVQREEAAEMVPENLSEPVNMRLPLEKYGQRQLDDAAGIGFDWARGPAESLQGFDTAKPRGEFHHQQLDIAKAEGERGNDGAHSLMFHFQEFAPSVSHDRKLQEKYVRNLGNESDKPYNCHPETNEEERDGIQSKEGNPGKSADDDSDGTPVCCQQPLLPSSVARVLSRLLRSSRVRRHSLLHRNDGYLQRRCLQNMNRSAGLRQTTMWTIWRMSRATGS